MGFAFDPAGNAAGAILMAGSAAIVFLTGVFLARGKYRRPPRALGPAEFARARREAEAMMAGLAPRLISLAEKERAVGGFEERGLNVAEISEEVSRSGVWRMFAVASARVEDEPLEAIEGMRGVEAALDGLLAKVREAEESSIETFGKEKS